MENQEYLITIGSNLVLGVIQYLETKPAKEVFHLLTALGQVCSPQFQAMQAQVEDAPEAAVN